MGIALQEMRERRARRKSALDRAAASITKQLEGMGALKIILFGSYAQGQVRSSSDLDIIAIMPPSLSGRQWMGRIYGELERDVDADMLAFTPDELERALPLSAFLRHALKTGKVVYERRPEE